MRIGTVTVNITLTEDMIENVMKVNKIDLLCIQYLENPLYNITREIYIVGEHTIIETHTNYNIIKYKDYTILQMNSNGEEETWEVLENDVEADIILGYFNEDSDSNTHFELTFEYIDSLKHKYHELEQFPPVTNVLDDARSTWILTKELTDTDSFELDQLTNGVWIDVRD